MEGPPGDDGAADGDREGLGMTGVANPLPGVESLARPEATAAPKVAFLRRPGACFLCALAGSFWIESFLVNGGGGLGSGHSNSLVRTSREPTTHSSKRLLKSTQWR